LAVGDPVRLLTPDGFKAFTIGGLFVDYGSDQGMLVMDRKIYRTLWQDDSISTLGIFLAEDTSAETALTALDKQLEGVHEQLRIRANKTIVEHSLAIFDRTFTITEVLRLLVISVAVVGILSAMMALQLERAKEHAILRATGVTAMQLLGQIGLQTSLMGLMAGLLALPLGWLMSEVLIHVINLRAFGWSLQSQLAPGILLQALALAIVAALMAGLYPGFKMAGTSPAQALREE
jgi:putative ABC transport system permease protein